MIIYAVLASYFAGVMVRLMLTLTPIVCVASAIAFSSLFDVFLKKPVSQEKSLSPASSEESISAPIDSSSTKDVKKLIAKSKKSSKSKPSTGATLPGIRVPDVKIMIIVPVAFLLILFW